MKRRFPEHDIYELRDSATAVVKEESLTLCNLKVTARSSFGTSVTI
jgi:hypothetical protein